MRLLEGEYGERFEQLDQEPSGRVDNGMARWRPTKKGSILVPSQIKGRGRRSLSIPLMLGAKGRCSGLERFEQSLGLVCPTVGAFCSSPGEAAAFAPPRLIRSMGPLHSIWKQAQSSLFVRLSLLLARRDLHASNQIPGMRCVSHGKGDLQQAAAMREEDTMWWASRTNRRPNWGGRGASVFFFKCHR